MSNARYGFRTFTTGEVSTLARKGVLQYIPFFTEAFGTPRAVYSMRKIRQGANNSIRVRRSNDNAEQDIGFVNSSPNASIDTSALTTFVGAGNDGFVTTWYDQSGNGFDITQTTGGSQPQIVSSGTIITDGGLPYIDFTNHFLNNTSTSIFDSSTNIFNTFMVAKPNVTNNDGVFFNIGKGNRGYAVGLGALGTANTLGTRLRSGSTNIGRSESTIGTTRFLHNALGNVSAGTNAGRFNGVAMSGNSQARSSGTPNRGDIVIGNSNLDTLNFPLDGKITELIIYIADKTSDFTAIETNINQYYNVF
jgi:hypothetical protein